MPVKLTTEEQGVESDSFRQRHTNNGLDEYLAKPVGASELVATIVGAVEREREPVQS